MNERDKQEFERWKVWHKTVYVSCLRHHQHNEDNPYCDKPVTEVVEGRCCMELCPRREEKK